MDLLTQIAALIAFLSSTGVLGHYWSSKRDKDKRLTDLEAEVKVLKATTVKESDVKHIIDEANRPLTEGISEIKEMMKAQQEAMTDLQEDITEIKIREAHREGMEAARAALKDEG